MDILLKLNISITIVTGVALLANAVYYGNKEWLCVTGISLFWIMVCGWALQVIAWVWL